MKNLIAIIFLGAFFFNMLHCIVLSYILRNYLMRLGKEKTYFAIGRISNIIELYKRAEASPQRKKYRNFVYYMLIAYFFEAVFLGSFLILTIFE